MSSLRSWAGPGGGEGGAPGLAHAGLYRVGRAQRRQWQDLLLEPSLPSDCLEDTAWRPDRLGRREGRGGMFGTGTDAPVPVVTFFLLCLLSPSLGEELGIPPAQGAGRYEYRRVLLAYPRCVPCSDMFQQFSELHGRYGPEGQLQGMYCWFFPGVSAPRAVLPRCSAFGRYGPLFLEVTCSCRLPAAVATTCLFLGDDSRNSFSIQHPSWFNSGYTFGISLRCLFEEFTLSFVKGGLSDPEVDPRPSDCKLWSLRSCSPSLSSTSLSWRTGRFPWSLSFSSCSTLIRCSTFVVQVQQVRVLAARTQSSSHSYSTFLGPGRSHARCVQRQLPMVDVLLQFIDLGGRRCDAAAT